MEAEMILLLVTVVELVVMKGQEAMMEERLEEMLRLRVGRERRSLVDQCQWSTLTSAVEG